MYRTSGSLSFCCAWAATADKIVTQRMAYSDSTALATGVYSSGSLVDSGDERDVDRGVDRLERRVVRDRDRARRQRDVLAKAAGLGRGAGEPGVELSDDVCVVEENLAAPVSDGQLRRRT